MSNPFVIFVGETKNNLEPMIAAPNLLSALSQAQELASEYPCVEVTYMPEDDVETNEVVFSHRT